VDKDENLLDVPEKDEIWLRTFAIAIVLDEFDKEQGVWLRGVADIMGCRKQWEILVHFGETITSAGEVSLLSEPMEQVRSEIKLFWEDK